MFNYGNANEAQKEAISATDGLVLITAGPGTGKTFTLVKRAVYLIQECGIKPEQIMMATFTEKAAKELITRITNELAERNVSVNVNEMYIGRADNKELLQFIRKHGKVHAGLTGTTDYAYSGLLYKLFMFRPFSDILDTDMSVGVVDIRPTRNLALLTQIIGKFEYLHRVDVFNGSYIDRNTELLFNLYLKLLYDGGISEYEDEAEYAPSGCVSFLTIHQSKGMEFPIVLVDSLSNVPRKTYKDLMTEVEEKYFHRPAFEPYDQTKYFDFWRLYYTAFSRAQNLLVLTCDENKRTPSQYFRDIYDEIQSVNSDEFDLSEFSFQSVKQDTVPGSYAGICHKTFFLW